MWKKLSKPPKIHMNYAAANAIKLASKVKRSVEESDQMEGYCSLEIPAFIFLSHLIFDWWPENGDGHGEESHLGERHCTWICCGRTLLPSWEKCKKKASNVSTISSPPPPSRLIYITPCFPFIFVASLLDLILIWKKELGRWWCKWKSPFSVFLSPLSWLSPPGLHPPLFGPKTPANVQVKFLLRESGF